MKASIYNGRPGSDQNAPLELRLCFVVIKRWARAQKTLTDRVRQQQPKGGPGSPMRVLPSLARHARAGSTLAAASGRRPAAPPTSPAGRTLQTSKHDMMGHLTDDKGQAHVELMRGTAGSAPSSQGSQAAVCSHYNRALRHTTHDPPPITHHPPIHTCHLCEQAFCRRCLPCLEQFVPKHHHGVLQRLVGAAACGNKHIAGSYTSLGKVMGHP